MESTCIITFANQKGGVGKTTLCALFASYLVSRGHSVTVFDTDPQQSIVKKRTADTATYAGVPLPYNIYPFSMSNEPALIALIENLHNSAAVDFALFDSAGSLNDQALLALFDGCFHNLAGGNREERSFTGLAGFMGKGRSRYEEKREKVE